MELAKIQNINVFDPSMFLGMDRKTPDSRTADVKHEPTTATQPKAVAASRTEQPEGE